MSDNTNDTIAINNQDINNQDNNEQVNVDEIKSKYEKEIANKDEIIKKLEEKLEKKESANNKQNKKIDKLNTDVQDKLAQMEKIKELQSQVDELVEERAEATVDTYIQKGIILPSQREPAKKLCLTDNDTFLDLYKDAKPLVETEKKRKSVPTGTAERIANYFKNK